MFKRILLEHPRILRMFICLNLEEVHVEKICGMIGSEEVS